LPIQQDILRLDVAMDDALFAGKARDYAGWNGVEFYF